MQDYIYSLTAVERTAVENTLCCPDGTLPLGYLMPVAAAGRTAEERSKGQAVGTAIIVDE